MTDRLLTEFETLPIRTVVEAIIAARAAFAAETGRLPAPELVATRARQRLVLRAAQAR